MDVFIEVLILKGMTDPRLSFLGFHLVVTAQRRAASQVPEMKKAAQGRLTP